VLPPVASKLIRDYLRDLIVDIRCARRDGLPLYAEECEAKFRAVWPQRFGLTVDRYGLPLLSRPV
jgi:hypothetical protein